MHITGSMNITGTLIFADAPAAVIPPSNWDYWARTISSTTGNSNVSNSFIIIVSDVVPNWSDWARTSTATTGNATVANSFTFITENDVPTSNNWTAWTRTITATSANANVSSSFIEIQ